MLVQLAGTFIVPAVMRIAANGMLNWGRDGDLRQVQVVAQGDKDGAFSWPIGSSRAVVHHVSEAQLTP
jgi:hypothetical protein